MAKKIIVTEETILLTNAINKLILKDLNFDNISSMLIVWNKINKLNGMLNMVHLKIESKVKKYMKKQHWSRYFDKITKINVSLDRLENEVIDKNKLKLLLTDSQMVHITNYSTKEVLRIVSEEQRKKIKNKLTRL